MQPREQKPKPLSRKDKLALFLLACMCLLSFTGLYVAFNPGGGRVSEGRMRALGRAHRDRYLSDQLTQRAMSVGDGIASTDRDRPPSANGGFGLAHALSQGLRSGHISDRGVRWYAIAKDAMINGRNSTRGVNGSSTYLVSFASSWFGGQHKWANQLFECPARSLHATTLDPQQQQQQQQQASLGPCHIAFYPHYFHAVHAHADVLLYHAGDDDVLPDSGAAIFHQPTPYRYSHSFRPVDVTPQQDASGDGDGDGDGSFAMIDGLWRWFAGSKAAAAAAASEEGEGEPAGNGSITSTKLTRGNTPRHPGQAPARHVLLAAENFNLLFFSRTTRRYNTEFTYRQRSLFRDGGYEILMLTHAQQAPAEAACFDDLGYPPPLPASERWVDSAHAAPVPSMLRPRPRVWGPGGATISWASSHCHSESGREGLVRMLQKYIAVDVFGESCLNNVNANASARARAAAAARGSVRGGGTGDSNKDSDRVSNREEEEEGGVDEQLQAMQADADRVGAAAAAEAPTKRTIRNSAAAAAAAAAAIAVPSKPPLPAGGPNAQRGDPWRHESDLLRRYKFHLAIENKRCEDYVTEKPYLALARGQVPVYFGAPNVDQFLPAGSYIDVRDFPTVSALAAHLAALDADEGAYNRYFEWRQQPFHTYPPVLRSILAETLPLVNRTGISDDAAAAWYSCSMCYALQAEEAAAAAAAARAAGPEGDEHNPLHPLAPVPPFSCLGPITLGGPDGDTIQYPELAERA